MKHLVMAVILGGAIVLSTACSHQAIQKTYWEAGTSVALDQEEKGNIGEAENELRIALGRARLQLKDDEYIASSLHNLGAFYRRQGRLSDAIYYLQEALVLEEKVSGPTSERAGRTMAELSAAYAEEGSLFQGRSYADRLKPLIHLYSGNEALFVQKVLEVYATDLNAYKKEIGELKISADAGDPKAQYRLAEIYFDSPDASRMLPEILALYERSAMGGCADAQYYLGVMHERGIAVEKDNTIARKWYRMAAESGHKIGQWNYAVFLLNGQGGSKDEVEAWKWVEKSAAQGHPSAQRAQAKHQQKK